MWPNSFMTEREGLLQTFYYKMLPCSEPLKEPFQLVIMMYRKVEDINLNSILWDYLSVNEFLKLGH